MLDFRFKQTPRHVGKIWDMIATPKIKTLLWSAIYLIVGSVGGYSLVIQPNSAIAYSAGPAVLYALCGLLVFGGALGLPSALFGETKLERIAASSFMLASFLYGVFLVFYHFESPSNRLLYAAFVLALGLTVVDRFVYLLQRPIAPKSETVLGQNS